MGRLRDDELCSEKRLRSRDFLYVPCIVLQTNTFGFVFQKRNAVALLSFHRQQREVRANPHTSL